MRGLKRNQRECWYQLYLDKVPVYETDLDGNIICDPVTGEPLETGEYAVGYGKPVKFRANVSATRGSSENDSFGISLDYTKSIVTCSTSLPIVEGSLIWETTPKNNPGKADYKVVAVARSLNSVTYAIKKIEKGEGSVTIN